jgi:hypothetical protein
MPSQLKTHRPHEPGYLSWRGELIARLALSRAGLVVQDAPSQPCDVLASTPDGFYFLVEVDAYSTMHSARRPTFDRSHKEYRWPVEKSVMRVATEVNLPVVLFVVDADTEAGYYARLDRLDPQQQKNFVSLDEQRDISPESLNTLVSELREDWAVCRRPA